MVVMTSRVGEWNATMAFEPWVRSDTGVRRNLARTTFGCKRQGSISTDEAKVRGPRAIRCNDPSARQKEEEELTRTLQTLTSSLPSAAHRA